MRARWAHRKTGLETFSGWSRWRKSKKARHWESVLTPRLSFSCTRTSYSAWSRLASSLSKLTINTFWCYLCWLSKFVYLLIFFKTITSQTHTFPANRNVLITLTCSLFLCLHLFFFVYDICRKCNMFMFMIILFVCNLSYNIYSLGWHHTKVKGQSTS